MFAGAALLISLLVGVSEGFVPRISLTPGKDGKQAVIFARKFTFRDGRAPDSNHDNIIDRDNIIFTNGTSIGYFPGGLRSNFHRNMELSRESIDPEKEFVGDADIMDEAIDNIRQEFQPEGSGEYGYDPIWHNCHDFRRRAKGEYIRLMTARNFREILKIEEMLRMSPRDLEEKFRKMEAADDRHKKELDNLRSELFED
ncbi:MAG: hypothetical protein LBU15_04160 [Rickettsiales bacterium]|jgi:hypothetical protein|nr:hypothetical protein [Rickettsiales bacterium]